MLAVLLRVLLCAPTKVVPGGKGFAAEQGGAYLRGTEQDHCHQTAELLPCQCFVTPKTIPSSTAFLPVVLGTSHVPLLSICVPSLLVHLIHL